MFERCAPIASCLFLSSTLLLAGWPAPSGARSIGFATRQDAAEVVVVDLSDGAILGVIPTLDESPVEIARSANADRLFVVGIRDSQLEVLDVPGRQAVQGIGVGSVPIELALLPDETKLYTADFFGGTVSAVDLASGARVAEISTAFLCYDVAVAPDGSRVYATSLRSGNLFVIDPLTDTVVDEIPVAEFALGHVAITPDGTRAYISEPRGLVSVVDLSSRNVVATIPFDASGTNLNNGVLDLEIDPNGRFAYLLGFDIVHVIRLAVDEVIATIPVGIQLSDVAIDETGEYVYVTTLLQRMEELAFNEIVKIDTANFQIRDRFVIGGLLVGLSVAPDLNLPPLANAGDNTQAECASPEGVDLTLDGSQSEDPDSTPGTSDDIVSFEWFLAFGTANETGLGSGEQLDVTLPLGVHRITLLVTDASGETDTDEVNWTVADTTPPSIVVAVTPERIWPPLHQMVDVEASVETSDICGSTTVRLESISSNEPDDARGGGDGHTSLDVQDAVPGIPDRQYRLRAERSGTGEGRIYTIRYTASDGSANESSAEAQVHVPRDQGG